MTISIRQAAHTCLQDLQNALNRHSPSGPADQRNWVQRRIMDFNTWATFSGVFREGIYSLDAKLGLQPDLRAGLVSLLQVFDALLSPMVGKSESWRANEIENKFSEIVSMTVLLRKSLANTGLWPDKDRAQNATGVLKGVRPHLAKSRSENPKLSSERVPKLDQKSIIQDLRTRLDNASSRRNKLFTEAQGSGALVANNESQSVWPPRKTNQFPPVPPIGAKDTEFVCQFCCRNLPAFFSDAYAWREHFLQDLSPYTCVLPNCPQPHCVYGTQRDWELHMKSVTHDGFDGRSWCCKVCQADFKSVGQLLWHLRATHVEAGTDDSDAQSPAEFISYVKLDFSHLRDCFVCNESISGVNILDHIASCMEVYALKSLKGEQKTTPNISIQIDEVDSTTPGTAPTPSEVSSDAGQHLRPISPAEFSRRRAISLPEDNIDIPKIRRALNRRSMNEQSYPDLIPDSELGRTWLETRFGMKPRSRSTSVERRFTKFRRLSDAASLGSAQYSTMLEEPRRKSSSSSGFQHSEARPGKSLMLQRYLDNHDRHEFIGRRKRNVSVG